MNNIVAVLIDVSSSMTRNEVQTDKGLKELVRTLQLREDDIAFFYAAFGDAYYPIIIDKPLDELGEVTYASRNDSTAMYAGIYRMVGDIEEAIKNATSKPNFVTLIIQTDGGNTLLSARDRNSALHAMNRAQASTNPRWRIIGLGDISSARQSYLEGAFQELGIPDEWMAFYDESTTVETFRDVAAAILEESVVPGQRTALKEV